MSKKDSALGLVGLSDDEGVRNVGGRLGAALGPAAFRKVFFKMQGFHGVATQTQDLGDAQTHKAAEALISQAIRSFERTVVVGGGHDYAYPHLKALGHVHRNIGCLNIDAHFDLRKPNPAITSGSPFYMAIEEGVLDPKKLTEFGIQRQSNSLAVTEYALEKKIHTVWMQELRNGKAVESFQKELKKLSDQCDAILLSIDLDAFAQAFAPGVSAPQAEGFTPSEVLEMVEIATQNKKVVSLGIYELNPHHDVDDKTARLAATLAWTWGLK